MTDPREMAKAANQLLDRIPSMNVYEALGVLAIMVRDLSIALAEIAPVSGNIGGTDG